MKNIKNEMPIEAIIFSNEKETLTLFTGLNVSIITDKTEYESDYSGKIEWLSRDEIKLENSEDYLPFDYIEEITLN